MIKPALFTLIAFTFFSIPAFAQGWTSATRYGSNSTTPILDALGRPVANQDITKMNGTSEVYDQWVPGRVTMDNGETYNGLLLKFDPKANLLTFVYDKTEAPQKFKDNVKVFALFANKERVFANGFPKFDGSNKETYYEVIAGGKAMLLEHHRQYLKAVRDGMALTAGEYTNSKHYYLFRDGKMAKMSLDEGSILKAFSDKAAAVSNYAAKQSLKFDNEADVSKLFDYYNNL